MFTTAAEIRAQAAQKRVQAAARQGAIRQIGRFLTSLPKAVWGALAYFLFSLIGVLSSRAYYSEFDINILDFFETSDFLLSAFQDLQTLIIGVGATLSVIVVVAWLAYNSIVSDAYRPSASDNSARDLLRWEAAALVVIFSISILVILYMLYDYTQPYIWSSVSFDWSWLVKPLCLIAGGIFACSFIMFIPKRSTGIEWESKLIIFFIVFTSIFLLSLSPL